MPVLSHSAIENREGSGARSFPIRLSFSSSYAPKQSFRVGTRTEVGNALKPSKSFLKPEIISWGHRHVHRS
ncbi:unnamed protein product [Ilex paraguariensis]|uniref:Uncharacterized protein n=1 Tax=Ilex paraguariensis TaxID=185542 RepID=A0ABC8SQ93_9AQUA